MVTQKEARQLWTKALRVDENGDEIEEVESLPWIWLQTDEPSGRADACDCRLDADGPDGLGSGAAFYMCSLHLAAAELLAALDGLLATDDTDGGDCQWCSESVAEYSECINPQCPGVRANAAIARVFSPQAQ